MCLVFVNIEQTFGKRAFGLVLLNFSIVFINQTGVWYSVIKLEFSMSKLGAGIVFLYFLFNICKLERVFSISKLKV